MKHNLSEIMKKSKKNLAYIIAGSVCILMTAIILITNSFTDNTQYLIKNGTLEKTEFVTAYVIKNEKTIEKDTTKTIVPVIANGSKTQKGRNNCNI